MEQMGMGRCGEQGGCGLVNSHMTVNPVMSAKSGKWALDGVAAEGLIFRPDAFTNRVYPILL